MKCPRACGRRTRTTAHRRASVHEADCANTCCLAVTRPGSATKGSPFERCVGPAFGASGGARTAPCAAASQALTGQETLLRVLGLGASGPLNSMLVIKLSLDPWLRSRQARLEVFHTPLVRKAFAVACAAHEGQQRKDGTPVVQHLVRGID